MRDRLHFDAAGGGFSVTVNEADTLHRVTIPRAFLDDEVGPDATHDARIDWIDANFANILQAITARQSGGIVQAPWGRLLVEEITDAD